MAKRKSKKTQSTNHQRLSSYNLQNENLKKNAMKIANKATRENASAESSAKSTTTRPTDGEEFHEMESNVTVQISPVEIHQNGYVIEFHQLPERNTTVIEALPRVGPKPDNKKSKNQSECKIPSDSRAVTRSKKRKNSSTSVSPSPSSSQSQTQEKSPKPKKFKHSSENEDNDLVKQDSTDFFWKNLHSFDSLADAVGKKLRLINDPNFFTMKLCHILSTRIIDMEKKLNERPLSIQNHDEFNQSLWVTKDGQRKQLKYRIMKSNNEYISRTDMENELMTKYMKRLSAKNFACKGTTKCDHPPLEKKGRNNKIYDHLRKSLGWTMECVYCPLGNNHNMEQFTKHLKKYHFDEETMPNLNQEFES